MTTELPFVGVDDVSIVQDSAGEVHVFAHPEEEVVIHQENPKTGEVGQDGHANQLSVDLFKKSEVTVHTYDNLLPKEFFVSKLEFMI